MKSTKVTSNFLRYHKLALAPFTKSTTSDLFNELRQVLLQEEGEFFKFIQLHDLAPLWYTLLKKNDADYSVSPQVLEMLRTLSFRSAANYLLQRQALSTIKQTFTESNIIYSVYKGAHIREHIYAQPAVRPSCDIDILVSKTDKIRAIKALSANGYTIKPSAQNISHEITLENSTTSLDLHWEILRPGRTRVDLTDELLKNSEDYSTHRGLNNEATLFVMLVHPVFVRYTSSNLASLVRMVDLLKWLQIQSLDFEKVHYLLDRGGVKTAAWITCTWLKLLTNVDLPQSFIHAIGPSPIKASYMRMWLQKNLSSRLFGYPVLIKAGFTLPAHDSPRDAYRATTRLFKERRSASENLANLLRAVKSSD